jgi:tryptophan synthase alpha chain
MGVQRFCESAKQAGVDGVLTVDLPPEEAGDWLPALAEADIDPIFLIAPTTDKARIQYIEQFGRGYLYYVSLKGVTGSHALNMESVANKVSEIRALSQLPIAVGFGIKDAASAAAMARYADAVVVGSALVSIVERYAQQPEDLLAQVEQFVASLRAAVDGADKLAI